MWFRRTNGFWGGGEGNDWLMSTSSSWARRLNSEVDEVCDTQILFTAPPPVRRASLPNSCNGLLCDGWALFSSCVILLRGEGEGGQIWLKSFGDGGEQ